ncbi:flavin reductase family protein [Salsuginibacillus kocurii]|uniref:flavin reductase family protein n=1 Tax=Salsuginibacillus kocurii TaxID=427078 RepID=UPI00035FABCF|nr:flavin reductase family protein [Salsuginibacillus kocurii]
MDDRLFKTAMGKFATGVTVVTTEVEGEVHGMTANAFMSVSLDPKLILISVANHARMKKQIETAGTFAVNLLSQEQKDLSMVFAGQVKEGRDVEFKRFEGQPILDHSLASIVCQVHNTHVEGDHTLFIGEVINLEVQDGEPLNYFEGKYRQFQEA